MMPLPQPTISVEYRTGTLGAAETNDEKRTSSTDSSSRSITSSTDSSSRSLPSSADSSRSRSVRSSILRTSQHGVPKRKRSVRVSFADTVATVHVVENLKLSLSRNEQMMIWEMPEDPEQEDLESSLCEAFMFGAPPASVAKKHKDEADKKRRRRKSRSADQKKGQRKLSPIRSITSRLGFRSLKKSTAAVEPIRD